MDPEGDPSSTTGHGDRAVEEVDPTAGAQVPCACQKRFAESIPFVLAVAVVLWAGERAVRWWRARRSRRP